MSLNFCNHGLEIKDQATSIQFKRSLNNSRGKVETSNNKRRGTSASLWSQLLEMESFICACTIGINEQAGLLT